MAAVHPRHLLPSARERIDHIAYELFSRHGVRSVGVDVVVARSGVAKKTLYSHYPSKEKLALAFLQRREELWTRTWLQEGVKRRARRPADRLLAIFDVFDSWFRRSDFEGCAFIKVLLEHDDPAHPIRRSTEGHIRTVRDFVRELAEEARLPDPEGFARQWQIVMIGSIIAAYAGDRDAARRAKKLGILLLADARIRSRGRAQI
ncbi:MAG: TetR family transcriptional regulator [Betaproteobacteria bacterium]|nr:MAG: TetR family transcriptional regulator [Betaproteobacteria bacterium]